MKRKFLCPIWGSGDAHHLITSLPAITKQTHNVILDHSSDLAIMFGVGEGAHPEKLAQLDAGSAYRVTVELVGRLS